MKRCVLTSKDYINIADKELLSLNCFITFYYLNITYIHTAMWSYVLP